MQCKLARCCMRKICESVGSRCEHRRPLAIRRYQYLSQWPRFVACRLDYCPHQTVDRSMHQNDIITTRGDVLQQIKSAGGVEVGR